MDFTSGLIQREKVCACVVLIIRYVQKFPVKGPVFCILQDKYVAEQSEKYQNSPLIMNATYKLKQRTSTELNPMDGIYTQVIYKISTLA